MDVVVIKPERKAQLEAYAQRYGQDTAAVLDDALAVYLEWEREDYTETVGAVTAAYAAVKAGRTRPANQFMDELREQHGFPR